MNINSTTSTSSSDLWQLLQEMQKSQASATNSNSSISSLFSANTNTSSLANGSGDSSSVSGPGQLFGELQNLSQSNPAEFKKITAQIATQLQAAAKNSTDPQQANFLNQMAANFQNASQSGNFSDLFSKQSQSSNSTEEIGGGSGHHHHRAHGYSDSDGDSSSSSTNSSDPLNSIFTQALSQIANDLGTSSSSN